MTSTSDRALIVSPAWMSPSGTDRTTNSWLSLSSVPGCGAPLITSVLFERIAADFE